MLLTANMPNATEFEVRDVTGRPLTGVMSYDTDSKEAEMYVFDKNGAVVFPFSETEYQPVVAQIFLPGSYAVRKRTGERV